MLLDLGCCFAQEMRTLVHDCAPFESIDVCELKLGILGLSYEPLKDKETAKAVFFGAEGKMDTT